MLAIAAGTDRPSAWSPGRAIASPLRVVGVPFIRASGGSPQDSPGPRRLRGESARPACQLSAHCRGLGDGAEMHAPHRKQACRGVWRNALPLGAELGSGGVSTSSPIHTGRNSRKHFPASPRSADGRGLDRTLKLRGGVQHRNPLWHRFIVGVGQDCVVLTMPLQRS